MTRKVLMYRAVEGPRGTWELQRAIRVPDDGENGGIDWQASGQELMMVPMERSRDL